MTVFFDKKRDRWRYDFVLAGVRYAQECRDSNGDPVTSKRAALNAENEVRRTAKIGPKLPRANELALGKVINDLAEGWQHEQDWPNKQRYAREIVAFFKPETLMRSIDGARIDDYKSFALKQPIMVWTGGSSRRRDDQNAEKFWKPHPKGKLRSPTTVNRYLPLLRMTFERAYKTRDPLTGERAIDEIPEIRDFDEPKRKARPTPDNVIVALYDFLPQYVIEAIKLTLYFGFRKSEAFSIEIHQIDFDRQGIWLSHADVKDDEDAFLPASRDALQFLAQLVDQARERGVRHLIARRRLRKNPGDQTREPWLPIKSPKSAWMTAMDTIEKTFGRRWRWHDIRASFITNVALKAGPIPAQKLARHSDFRTTEGYIEVADEITRAAVEKASDRPALKVVKR